MSLRTSELPLGRYPFLWNQSSMADFSRSSGTLLPISSTPSETGNVSSKIGSLVKLRMAKLSSHFSGHGASLPEDSYATESLRENIYLHFRLAIAGSSK